MLKQSLVTHTLEAALQTGADFAEVYAERTKRNRLETVNGVVETAFGGMDYGVGIRLFFGNRVLYGYTNDVTEQSLIQTARTLAAAQKGTQLQKLQPYQAYTYQNRNPIQILPNSVEKRKKAERLFAASAAASAYDSRITQTKASFLDVTQEILVANTEGIWAEDCRIRSRFSIEAVASSASEKQSGHLGPGGAVGFELFSQIDAEQTAKEAARIAVTMLGARHCPAGKMPVVIENGFGGVIFHEACGHGLEATAVAKNASVFAGKLGEQIASPLVTAIDDGTIPNAWGSANIDDEGTPTRKNILIENGILKSYLIDRMNGKRMGMVATGSARRQNYRYAPTSRMTNTFLAAGDTSVQQMIKDTNFGLYAKQMGGGSVDPATGSFNFAVLEGYLIRNGEICEPVRGATLIGKGAEVLLDIDRVGNNLKRAQGMCGSISGSIPTDVGQPAIRVKEMTVGGRG